VKTAQATVGARGVDSLPYSSGGTLGDAKNLRDCGAEFFVGYLGVIDTLRLGFLLDAGLAFMPVTRAGTYDGAGAADACVALGLTPGCTVWLDLEGQAAFATPPQDLMAKIDAWADAVGGAGFQPGLYVGSPQPLTGDELFRLKVVRYWKAPSRIFDRNGRVWDGPSCGFCMYQLWPSLTWRSSGVLVDVDFVQQDHLGRLPSWVEG
jgi:hypothetical protein